jgi:hypothetical protein
MLVVVVVVVVVVAMELLAMAVVAAVIGWGWGEGRVWRKEGRCVLTTSGLPDDFLADDKTLLLEIHPQKTRNEERENNNHIS